MSATSDKVLTVTKTYLGPAAESFLARQCQGHLHIEVSALNQSHLKELAKWVEVGAALVMDAGKAAELSTKIASL
jgi:hypothetical protein